MQKRHSPIENDGDGVRVPVAQGLLCVLRLANHNGPFVLPAAAPDEDPIEVRTQQVVTLGDGLVLDPACPLVVIDWVGVLAPAAVASVCARTVAGCCLMIGDAAQAGAARDLKAAGATDWLAREELTPYWLARTLHSHCAAVLAEGEKQTHLATLHKAMERALRESEAHFRAVIDHTPILLARFDRDMFYRWVHSGLPEYGSQDLLNKRLGEAAPSEASARLRAWVEEVIRTGEGMRTLNEATRPDGSKGLYDLTLEPTLDDKGNVTGVTLAGLDVTATYAIQDALRASERRYRTLVQSTSVGVLRLDGVDGHVVEIAPIWERFSGQHWPDYAYGQWLECVHPDERADVQAMMREVCAGTNSYKTEARFLEVETQMWRWCEIRLSPIAGPSGSVEEWVCVIRDINDRKVAEQQLARHARELETLLDTLPVAVFFAHDARAENITANRMGSALTRVPMGANLSLSAEGPQQSAHFYGRMNGRRVEPHELPMQRAVLTGVDVNEVEVEHVYNDGTVIALYGNARPLLDEAGNVRGGVAAFMDVTERNQLMERLASSEARFVAFMDNLPAQAYMKDAEGRYLFVNQAHVAAGGIAREQWLGRTDAELFPDQDVRAWAAHDQQVIQSEQPNQYTEVAMRAVGPRNLLSVKFPIRTRDGQLRVGGLSFDVTVQRKIEAALVMSEERLRLAVSGGALGMWEWDGKDTLLFNRRMCNFLNLEATDEETAVHSRSVVANVHADDVGQVSSAIAELIALGDGEFRSQVRVPLQNGEQRWLLLVGHLHTVDTHPHMLGVAIDVTESKRAEEVIRRAQEELEQRVELRTRQLAASNSLLRREVDERRQTEARLAEIRSLLARSQEVERMHLAHELHDGPMQELAVLGFELSRAMRSLAESPVARDIASIRDRLQTVNFVLRNVTSDLRPPLLDTFGLVAGISDLVEEAQQRSPEIAITAHLPADETALDDQVNLAIYRVCQQALHNMRRHAQATAVRVELAITDESVLLTVTDNGKGFATPKSWVELARAGHMGVAGMEERMRGIGGTFTLESAPGAGTVVRVVAPRAA